MKSYKTINNLFGWICFIVAAVTYCLTAEPTASFWDCPEFILSGNKLEIGHPPGAPFFMLTANVFSLFASPENVALMVNIMSAVLSAAGIMFLFWSITHLVRKLIVGSTFNMSTSQMITIIGSGLVGALAYTWSDTYWFSAVEGEVYGYSSLFTAVVFWLILKWEDNADAPHSDRWLILIAYLVGLSIGVHLLNLLCIPAIVLVAYYRKAPNANLKGSLIALALSMVLVAAVLYGIVPGVVKVGGWFELFFVNTLGLPFNSGLIVYLLTMFAALMWAIFESETGKNRKRLAIAFLLTVALLGIPFYGHGFGSILIGVVVLAALAVVLFSKIQKKLLVNTRILNTSLLCMLLIMVGYSSYALIVIRSAANTPMDQNSPEDIFTLGEYLGREQYGTRPLFYGQAYDSKIKYEKSGRDYTAAAKLGAPEYGRKEKATPDEKDSYELLGYKKQYIYAQNMLFPRMYDPKYAAWGPKRVNLYEQWVGSKIKGRTVKYSIAGQNMDAKMPTQWENFKFFMNYQLNFMYWRYFLWNFVGRQNDLQSHGELDRGNWITGISFIDNLLVGNQELLPKALKENKGRNVFFALPLLLGILGLLWQCKKGDEGIRQFWVVFFLFFMTGIAIVLYLNQTPIQPRERDYAYAGSFYAFAIWIGMGVAAITEWLKSKKAVVSTAVAGVCLLVPLQMVSQTWDDHDRSGRYTCRDFGQNYLMSLDEGKAPIIFTNGDNDTFPLWYCQETEGFRTDARVCNLSYLQTDWYIDQMKRPAYDSPAVPITWKRLQYVTGTREGISVRPGELERAIEILKDDPQAMRELLGENPYELSNIIDKWILNDDEVLQCFPTDSVVITIDKEAVRRSGMMIAGDSIPDVMHISLKGKRAVYKNEMMIYEMLCRTNWERPMYVACTVGSDNYGSLGNNFVREGLADRITPFNTKESGMTMDTERMYDNLMNKFRFGGLDNPDIYLDETVLRMCYTHRRLFATLAMQLMREGKEEKALEVVRYAKEVIPAETVRHNYMSGSMDLARVWLMHGEKQEAEGIVTDIATNACEYLDWYATLKPRVQQSCAQDILYNVYQLSNAVEILESAESANLKEMEEKLQAYHVMFSGYLYR